MTGSYSLLLGDAPTETTGTYSGGIFRSHKIIGRQSYPVPVVDRVQEWAKLIEANQIPFLMVWNIGPQHAFVTRHRICHSRKGYREHHGNYHEHHRYIGV